MRWQALLAYTKMLWVSSNAWPPKKVFVYWAYLLKEGYLLPALKVLVKNPNSTTWILTYWASLISSGFKAFWSFMSIPRGSKMCIFDLTCFLAASQSSPKTYHKKCFFFSKCDKWKIELLRDTGSNPRLLMCNLGRKVHSKVLFGVVKQCTGLFFTFVSDTTKVSFAVTCFCNENLKIF